MNTDYRNDMDIFLDDTEIPSVVRRKADAAFDRIREEAGSADKSKITFYADSVRLGEEEAASAHHGVKISSRRGARHARRKYIVVGLAAAVAAGCVALASENAFHWSRSIQSAMHADEEQMANAQNTGLSDNPAPIEILSESEADTQAARADERDSVTSVTIDGITVSADQTLVDNYRAVISLKIHGLKLDEGAEPNIADFSCAIDGVDSNWSSNFYDGTISGPDGYAYHEDGTAIDLSEENSLQYTDENGDYEYIIDFDNSGEPGAMIGKEIQISIAELGELVRNEQKDQYENKVLADGTFHLHWVLKGSDQVRIIRFDNDKSITDLSGSGASAEFTVTESASGGEIGGTGATLEQAEISPISIRLTINWPYQDETEMGIDEDGNESVYHDFVEAPGLTALEFKDGTISMDTIDGPSFEGYSDQGQSTYVSQIRLQRIIDPDQVSALLFLKPETVQKIEDYAREHGDHYDFSTLTESDFYSVSLGK